MYSKIVCTLKTKVVTLNELRIAGFILTLGMFILGMPTDGGGLGG
jgi:hypothetical protein